MLRRCVGRRAAAAGMLPECVLFQQLRYPSSTAAMAGMLLECVLSQQLRYPPSTAAMAGSVHGAAVLRGQSSCCDWNGRCFAIELALPHCS